MSEEEKKEETAVEEETLAKTPEELIEYWKNKYLYALADVRNVSEEKNKQLKNIQKYYFQSTLENLFPVLDAFEASLKVETSSQETRNFLTGFQYIYQMFQQTLQNEGVEEIVPNVGDKFDHRVHQATAKVEVEDAEKDELITEVNKKGYRIQERIVRPADVVISVSKK